jgi:hypothetical protein
MTCSGFVFRGGFVSTASKLQATEVIGGVSTAEEIDQIAGRQKQTPYENLHL